MKSMTTKLVAISTLMGLAMNVALSTPAQADPGDGYKKKIVYVDKSTGVKIKIKEKGTYDFGGWKRVESIKVKVKTPNGKFKLVANGMEYTNGVYYPGPNPYYEYRINQAVRGFDLFNLGDADCILDGIEMDIFDVLMREFVGGSGLGGACTAEELREVMNAVDGLKYNSSLEEIQTYLQPIQTLAGKALAKIYGRGAYSVKSSEAILAMLVQIEFAKEFLDAKMAIPATYSWSVYLLAHKERLSDLLD